jgi:hypothetical protein
MPATSEARIRANQLNSQKSTGPRTPEGKERSRRNGLKHGMTGRGVVVADEDAPEVERRASALMGELDPRSTLGAIMVGQMATLSVRMERGARQEEEALASRVRHAPEAFDRERVEWATLLFDRMMQADDPRDLARELRTSPEGIDRLLTAWADARADLTHPPQGGWSFLNLPRATRLAGMRPADSEWSRPGVLRNAILGDFSRLAPEEGEGLDDEQRRRWAVDRLVEWIDAEVAKLEALRATLDFQAIALDRAGAADVALFDPSPEASRARRYEAEARRGFFRAWREFRRVESEAEAREEVEAVEEASEVSPEGFSLGSCWEPALPVVSGVRSSPPEDSAGLVRAVAGVDNVARGLDGRVVAIGRATFGGG